MEGIRPKEGCIIYCSNNSASLVRFQDESWSTLIEAPVIQEANFQNWCHLWLPTYYTSFEGFLYFQNMLDSKFKVAAYTSKKELKAFESRVKKIVMCVQTPQK